jgi:hypothetical protein
MNIAKSLQGVAVIFILVCLTVVSVGVLILIITKLFY